MPNGALQNFSNAKSSGLQWETPEPQHSFSLFRMNRANLICV